MENNKTCIITKYKFKVEYLAGQQGIRVSLGVSNQHILNIVYLDLCD